MIMMLYACLHLEKRCNTPYIVKQTFHTAFLSSTNAISIIYSEANFFIQHQKQAVKASE